MPVRILLIAGLLAILAGILLYKRTRAMQNLMYQRLQNIQKTIIDVNNLSGYLAKRYDGDGKVLELDGKVQTLIGDINSNLDALRARVKIPKK